MSVTVRNIMALVEDMAPAALAEDYDNVGLLAGHPSSKVDKVLCALDFTAQVLDEAMDAGAQLIVTHHPILFRGRKNLREDDPEGALLVRLVRSGIALIAAHTNFDNAEPGVNDALAQALGLENMQVLPHGLRMGEIPACTFDGVYDMCADKLDAVVRPYGLKDKIVEKIAVCGGSGGDFYPAALAAGADVFITGEIGYHKALSAVDEGMNVLEAGHDCTERPAIKMLSEGLQIRANALQYKVDFMVSR